MMQFIQQFVREEDGQDVVEYGLVLGLVALAGAVGLGLMADQVGALLTSVTTLLTDAVALVPPTL
jgi:Flp pilus assembly pilin Flp